MLRGFSKMLIEAKRGSQTVLRSTTKQELKGWQQLPAKHFFPIFCCAKGWGGVIWVRMNYLNTPLIRLQVLIDAPTLFLTLLKEIFGILAGLIIFNVFEYLKLQLLNRYWNIYWLFDQTAVCRRKSKAIEKHFLSKFNDVLQRIHIHSHSRKVCIQVLSQNMRRRHK